MTNEELQKEMIAAMKAKDKTRLSIIRQVKAEVKNIEVNERRDVTEEDVNGMIKRLIKQTSETLDMSIKAANNAERTETLTEQVEILQSLLPRQISGEDARSADRRGHCRDGCYRQEGYGPCDGRGRPPYRWQF